MTFRTMPDTGRGVPIAVQNEVLRRDGMTCQWCGCTVVKSRTHRPDRLHLDHVIQWSHGGPSTAENLVVSCARCNLGRKTNGWNVRSPIRNLYGFSYGYYRWLEDVDVPRQLTGIGIPLRDYLTSLIRPQADPTRIVGQVLRGELAGTTSGRIYVEYHPGTSRPQRHGRRYAR